jgi:hypothetical protein
MDQLDANNQKVDVPPGKGGSDMMAVFQKVGAGFKPLDYRSMDGTRVVFKDGLRADGLPAPVMEKCTSASLRTATPSVHRTALQLKLGLWEMTFKGKNSGFSPIPPEALAAMTPEQRAQRETAMAKQLEPRVFKQCLTQRDIDQGLGRFQQNDMTVCAETVVSDTPTLRAEKLLCPILNNAAIAYRIDAPTPESLAATWDMTSASDADGHKMTGEMHGKWLGPDCGDVKPQSR